MNHILKMDLIIQYDSIQFNMIRIFKILHSIQLLFKNLNLFKKSYFLF